MRTNALSSQKTVRDPLANWAGWVFWRLMRVVLARGIYGWADAQIVERTTGGMGVPDSESGNGLRKFY
jgi:hypothetical protein